MLIAVNYCRELGVVGLGSDFAELSKNPHD